MRVQRQLSLWHEPRPPRLSGARAGDCQVHTRLYRPQASGRDEALVHTLLNSSAFAQPRHRDAQRIANLTRLRKRYDHHRPHGGVGGLPPMSRVFDANNVCGNYS